jgi:GNAT superfamily N-acetyltransferase
MLREAQQVELRARYGDDGTPEPPLAQVLTTLLLRVDGVPVACGSLRDVAAEQGAGVAEVKRVFVAPGHRGTGLARTVMHALHERARTRGLRRLVLETGLQQPEAIGLYLSLGYTSLPNYGEWAGVTDSRCFALDLAPAPAAPGPAAPVPARDPRPVEIALVPFADPEAAALRTRMYTEALDLYPEVQAAVEARGGFAVVDAALGPAMLATALARVDGRAVGCASLGRPQGLSTGDPARTGELRRVYAAGEVRRLGVASALVRALEEHAVTLGLDTVVLETGIRQPAAVALYRSLGYRPVLPFGDWRGDPLGLYLGRDLAVR